MTLINGRPCAFLYMADKLVEWELFGCMILKKQRRDDHLPLLQLANRGNQGG